MLALVMQKILRCPYLSREKRCKEMTLEEFIEANRAKIRLLEDRALNERLGVVACNRISALVKRRVYRDGIAQNGSPIGRYSTKEGYFTTSLPGLPKIAPKSKVGRKGNKTFYSKTGYKGYREAVGRQSETVDLNLTGATFQATGVGQGQGGKIAFGIKNRRAAEIMDSNEQRFGKIIASPNQTEVESAHDDVREELAIILKIK